MESFGTHQRRWRLARRHLLARPGDTTAAVAAITDDLVALHSSDPVSVYLSLAARAPSLSVGAIDSALYEDRSVLRHHAMRRTLWITSPEMAPVVHAACTRKIAAAERRRLVKALDGDEAWLADAMDEVVDLLSIHGPMFAREVGERRPHLRRELRFGTGTRHAASVAGHTRVLLQAGFEGRIVRARPAGSWTGSQYRWTATGRWTPVDFDHLGVDEAAASLVAAWLRRFGPGTTDDVVWWTGITKTAVRRALDAIEAVPVRLDGGRDGWLAPDDDAVEEDPGPWVALLPGLDPTAMGWKERAWYLADDVAARVIDRSGNIGPTVWADGEIVGGWGQRADGRIATERQRPLDRVHQRLLDEEIDRLTAFVGDTRFRVRFPSPNQADLLGS